MKKIFMLLLMVLLSVTLVGCGDDNSDNSSSKSEKKESVSLGKYSIEDLYFNLPDGYTSGDKNFYSYSDDENGIWVHLYADKNYEGTLDDYISKDKNMMYPVIKSLTEIELNGETWLKGKSSDNDTLYYIKHGNDCYVVALSPLFAKAEVYNNLISTIEGSLVFK